MVNFGSLDAKVDILGTFYRQNGCGKADDFSAGNNRTTRISVLYSGIDLKRRSVSTITVLSRNDPLGHLQIGSLVFNLRISEYQNIRT